MRVLQQVNGNCNQQGHKLYLIRHSHSILLPHLPSLNWLKAFFIAQQNLSPSIPDSCKTERQYLCTFQGCSKDSLIRYRLVFKRGDSTTSLSLHACPGRVRTSGSSFPRFSLQGFGETVKQDIQRICFAVCCKVIQVNYQIIQQQYNNREKQGTCLELASQLSIEHTLHEAKDLKRSTDKRSLLVAFSEFRMCFSSNPALPCCRLASWSILLTPSDAYCNSFSRGMCSYTEDPLYM